MLETIPDYTSGDINDIAQEVQRSGHPEAYRDHETEGRLYASALTGQSGANLVCTLGAVGSTVSPEQLRAELGRQFPRATGSRRLTSSLASASGTAPQLPADAGATALVIDPGGDETLGWTLANWAVARAADDGVARCRIRTGSGTAPCATRRRPAGARSKAAGSTAWWCWSAGVIRWSRRFQAPGGCDAGRSVEF